MGIRTYENFDVSIEPAGPQRYRARVTSGEADDEVAVDLAMPFDDTTLENFLLRLDPGRALVRSAGPSPATLAAERLGTGLYTALFSGDVADAWARARTRSWEADRGIRVRLRFAAAPELAALPWELLRDPTQDTFLALSERTPVVRHLSVNVPLRPLAVQGPLRILAVLASPGNLPTLDVEGEWGRLQEAVAAPRAAGRIVLDRLPQATVAGLAAWLRTHEVHVLHVVAHGEVDSGRGEGVVYLEDAAGQAVAAGVDVLGPFVRDHDPLRMVVLNACRSATGEPEDLFSGLAQGLVRQNVGAVVAMQFPITDAAACGFAGTLYAALVAAQPVDQAVTAARKSLLVDHGVEWATPVLFLRAVDGVVFESLTAAEPDQTPVAEASVPMPRPTTAPLPTTAPSPTTPPRATVPLPTTAHSPTKPSAPVPNAAPSSPLSQVSMLLIGGGVVLALVLVFLWVLGGEDPDGQGGQGESVTAAPSSPAGSASAAEVPTLAPGMRLAAPGVSMTAERVAAAPVIDGVYNDWADRPAYVSDHVIAPIGVTSGVSARWWLSWDPQALYVFASVTDPVITQTHAGEPSQLYQGDSVSFEVGPYLDAISVEQLQDGDVHVLIGPTQDGGWARAINIAGGAHLVTGPAWDSGAVGVMITADGYDVEAAIPWATLRLTPPEAGQVIAMNLNVSDAWPDGPGRGELAAMLSNNPDRLTNSATKRDIWGALHLNP